jgi:hypothetical protein
MRQSRRAMDYSPPLVISVHGIRTHGSWQKVFAAAMSGSSTKTEAFEYGRYGLVRFLTPPFNDRLVDRFYNWFHQILNSTRSVDLKSYDKRPCVVAHSLGSWIVGRAMLKHSDLRFDKLVFAGSILPRDFDWGTLFARDQVSFVRNECGQQDPWPAWAGRLVRYAGSGGSDGFDWFGTAVENDVCEWFGHSDALMRGHIETHWLPVLRRPPSPLALLHGHEIHDLDRFSGFLDHTGTVIDKEAYGDLAHYPEVEIPRGLSLEWIKVNADIYTFLIDRETGVPAGYINAMPVDDAAYTDIRSGKRADNAITANDVLPYLGPRTVKIYLMSIAIAEEHRRWGEGMLQTASVQLLTGFLDKLIQYARYQRVRATHFIATAWTPEGRRMCQHFGMHEIGKDKFGDGIFEVDLDALGSSPAPNVMYALRRLLEAYRKMDA